jgi:hypothetical protein
VSGGEPPLRLATVYGRAIATYRSRWRVVAGAAFLVFGPLAALETAVGLWVGDEVTGSSGIVLAFLSTLALAASGSTGAAVLFYAGLLDHVVGEDQHGLRHRSVGEVLRTLPYSKLIVADVLLVVAATVGFALLVVPGFVVMTLFALTGPLINIEGLGVKGSFRRSAAFVWPHFWTVLVAVTIPVTLEHILAHGIDHVLWDRPVAAALVMNGLLGVAIGALAGLTEVTIAHELVARGRAAVQSSASRRSV